ncbi:NAD(P)-binding protein [Aulographum hederae CBS 113979]|uniref:NAD(P)-binding protein n=1 Tax=Aulographum hederae CBS 113979 TaxID=1176131 RepID=A0A6G1H7B6_9PEZI|nr:NAD(P)-binding protein [Aulographum hederae CBS 113979]
MSAPALSLANKTAIVTGSGRENGIGAAIARALARAGAAITINHVSASSASRAEGVAESIRSAGGKAVVVQANVSKPEDAKKLVEATLKAFGGEKIDILVNNAGTGSIHTSEGASVEYIESIFATNVFGTIYTTQAVLPYMPKGGRIVNISSVASKLGMMYLPIYGASKAAMDSLTFAWAGEFGRSKGITVNSIAPGPVATDLGDVGHGEMGEATASLLVNATRAGARIGTVEDIADAVLLVASEQSRWITGQFISASGGITGQ